MVRIQFRSPVTVPIHRQGECSPASDDFCVTQRFDSPDFYWTNVPNPPNPLPTHKATDIGNFRCGYPIVAMAPGTAWRVQDNATSLGAPNNALGIVIDHGSGIKTAYWHLASQSVPNGSLVQAGQEIGKLGNTGLGQTCHTHIEAFRDGVKFDPEPLMFGGSVQIGDDVQLPPSFEYPMDGLLPAGTRIRSSPQVPQPDPSVNVIETLATESRLAILGRVFGQGGYTLNGVQGRDWLVTAIGPGSGELAYVAEPLWSDIRLTQAGSRLAPSGSGITQGDVDQAKAASFLDAKTKARVAVEGIKP